MISSGPFLTDSTRQLYCGQVPKNPLDFDQGSSDSYSQMRDLVLSDLSERLAADLDSLTSAAIATWK